MGRLEKVLKKIERQYEVENNVVISCEKTRSGVINSFKYFINILEKEIAKKKAKKKHKSKPDLSKYEVVDGSCCECELKRECDENEKHIAEWCSTCLGEIYRKKETPEDWIADKRECVFNDTVIGTLEKYRKINKLNPFQCPFKCSNGISYTHCLPLDQWYAKHGRE